MSEFFSDIVDQLYSELRFAPRHQQEKELAAARELALIVEAEKEYPFEFICFKLTGYRPREDMSGRFVSGEDLVHDLQIIINKISRKVAPAADEYPEKVYTVEDLAGELSVSTKTIRRWRQRGLMGWMFVFGRGKPKLGFPESAVREFADANPEITKNASNFSKLTDEEREHIIELAAKFALDESLSRYQVILRVAKETGRARETIRCELINYEKGNSRRSIFSKAAGVIRPEDAKEMHRFYVRGTGVKELMEIYGRSRSSIHRIINKRRWKVLSRSKIEYIDSPEFLSPEAAEGLLASGGELLRELRKSSVRLLNRQEEMELFRFYNYLKRIALSVRSRIDAAKVSGRLLTEAESFLRRSEEVKRVLIEANLGLVVSVARKHLRADSAMPDLISEGNLALMRAVEKFDYTRGHRFSTYATLAIAKDFATKIPAEVSRQDRAGDVDSAEFSEDVRSLDFANIVEIERANLSLEQVIRNNLTKREQYVIRSHFGLEGNRITRKAKTLEDIGKTLGLSKERVRQIELIALQQLRHCLSPKEFDLLMK